MPYTERFLFPISKFILAPEFQQWRAYATSCVIALLCIHPYFYSETWPVHSLHELRRKHIPDADVGLWLTTKFVNVRKFSLDAVLENCKI